MPRRRRRSHTRTLPIQRGGVRGLRFEPLERREMLAADFGDAAGSSGSPYSPASHEAVGPMLGVLRDANTIVTNSLANGDAQDEDGVAFGLLRAGQTGSMTVYVTNAPAGAKLDAWIDFARDSNFADSFDQIVDNLAVVEGDNVVTFSIPATVAGGHYYARVRLSTAGNLAHSGAAADGEVEDYLIPIAHADSGLFGGQQPVSFNDAPEAIPADLDSDGDLDLLTSRLTWIENVNGHYGAELQITTSPTQAFIAPADVDGDGDMDVIASNSLRWYENDGQQRFTSRTIDSNASPSMLKVADLDGDGDVDIVSNTSGGGIEWRRNNGSGSFTKITYPNSPLGINALEVADMDGDGDFDLLAAKQISPDIERLENDGNGNFQRFQVGVSDAGIHTLKAVDFDGDGDRDVVAFSKFAEGITWYENVGEQSFTLHEISPAPMALLSGTVADLDADGDVDLAVSGISRVGWYENDGDQAFAYHEIAQPAGTHVSIAAGDFDCDGRLDLVTAGSSVAPIAVYRQIAEYDFGDAPHPYHVYLQNNAARHNAVGPTLGALRDAEADGAHAPAGAEAEDDGVAFGAVEIGQGFGLVTVNVQNAPVGARLDAWIDFNGDGTWAGGEEQIFSNLAVVEGDNSLAFAIPSGAVAGATTARFRLSTAGGLGVNGAALDGEVEDHELTLLAREPATGLFGTAHPIPASANDFVATADIDGDGDADVITKTFTSVVTWHENLGAAGFAAHAIPGNSTINTEDVVARDLDSDGDVDVVGVVGPQLVWLENDGHGSFTRRTQALAAPMFAFGTPVALDIADIDGDGDQDVLSAHLGGGLYAMLNDGQQRFSLRRVGPEEGLHPYTSVVAADVDRDGDLDVVAGGVRSLAGSPTANVMWYQNDGALSFTPHIVKLRPSNPQNVFTETVAVGDMNGDGDLDIVAGGTPGSSSGPTAPTLTWHEQVADNQWVQHDIEFGGTVRWVELADFDADGDLDIVSTGWGSPTVVYENVGVARFHRRQLTPGTQGGWSVAVADMDRDGDLDVVTPVVPGGGTAWFENIDLVESDYGDAPAPYPTTRADDGPVHNGGGPQLGATRDAEADGAPTSAADGDAGDDGVTLPAVQVGDASGTLIVHVQNAPAGAKLDAWIDWSGDGSFDGAGEQIFASRSVVGGDNTLTFNIPANTPAGAVAARFRISTAGGLRTTGAALDGEVEDYMLTIAPPDAATAEYGPRRFVSERADSIRVADIDGDGDADFLNVSPTFPYLQWHENLGDGAFLAHRLFGAAAPRGARLADFDRDGDIDIVVTSNSGLGWYENNGAEAFTYRSQTSVTTALHGVFDVGDVDADGDLDVIVPRGSGNQGISILLNDGGQRFASSLALTTPTQSPAAIRAADVDGDGDLDFAITFNGNSSGWYENDDRTWTYRSITPIPPGDSGLVGRDIVPVDFDQDGDVDLVTLSYSLGTVLELFRNDGAEFFTRETLAHTPSPMDSAPPTGGDRLQIADLDGDGDLDAVAGTTRGIYAYRNDGPAPFTQLQLVIAQQAFYFTPVAVADLDADGRLEILGSNDPSIAMYWLDDLHFGDYNRDGMVDQADRDLYEATLGQTATPPGAGADGDRSGVVDAADLAIWEANQGRGPAPIYRPADFDQNESINGHDFLRWQQRVGMTPSPLGYEDPDPNGAIDGGDLAVWTRHFGQGVPRAILPPAIESSASSSDASAPFTLAANVFLEAPAHVADEEEVVADRSIAPDAVAFDAALTAMAPAALAPVSRPDSVLKIATGSQRAPRVPPALADKLLDDLWGE